MGNDNNSIVNTNVSAEYGMADKRGDQMIGGFISRNVKRTLMLRGHHIVIVKVCILK